MFYGYGTHDVQFIDNLKYSHFGSVEYMHEINSFKIVSKKTKSRWCNMHLFAFYFDLMSQLLPIAMTNCLEVSCERNKWR